MSMALETFGMCMCGCFGVTFWLLVGSMLVGLHCWCIACISVHYWCNCQLFLLCVFVIVIIVGWVWGGYCWLADWWGVCRVSVCYWHNTATTMLQFLLFRWLKFSLLCIGCFDWSICCCGHVDMKHTAVLPCLPIAHCKQVTFTEPNPLT